MEDTSSVTTCPAMPITRLDVLGRRAGVDQHDARRAEPVEHRGLRLAEQRIVHHHHDIGLFDVAALQNRAVATAHEGDDRRATPLGAVERRVLHVAPGKERRATDDAAGELHTFAAASVEAHVPDHRRSRSHWRYSLPLRRQALLRVSQPHASRAPVLGSRPWPATSHRLQERRGRFRATAKHRFSVTVPRGENADRGSRRNVVRTRAPLPWCLPEALATAHNLDERGLLCTYVT